jgi:hypothetical protein
MPVNIEFRAISSKDSLHEGIIPWITSLVMSSSVGVSTRTAVSTAGALIAAQCLQHDSLSSNNIDKYEYAKSHQTPSSCQILVKLPHGGLGGILNEEPGEQTSDVVGLISGSVMWESLAAADLETHTHSIAAPVIATHCSAYRFVMQLHSATASGRGH